jgi:hypothetical protein
MKPAPLSMMSVVLSGRTPEPDSGPVLPAPGAQALWPAGASQDGQVSVAEGSDRVAEMTGQAVVITEPSAGIVSLMRDGWSSQLVSKSQAVAQRSRKYM